MAKGRPISQRDTATRSAGEALRRLAFVVYIVSGLGGGALLIAAAVQKSPVLAAGGAAALVACAVLHLLGRRRVRFAAIGVEIRRNPFKPRQEPATDDGGDASPGEH